MKQLLCLTVLILLSLPSRAQTTDSPELGRLFTTPEKRVQLDRQRKYQIRDADSDDNDTLQLNGIVQRSSGHNSVWINHRLQNSDADGDFKVNLRHGDPAQASITTDDKKPTSLHVGESINRTSQERTDLIGPNAIRPGTTAQTH